MRKQGAERQTEILAVLKQEARPLTAYEILALMRGSDARLAPPTVYRALAQLVEDGRAHRIESINAYVACQGLRHTQEAVLDICEGCGSCEESVDAGLASHLSELAGQSGFIPTRHVVEVHGYCFRCSAEKP